MNKLFSYILPIRKAVYVTMGLFDRAILHTRNQVFILSYHSIANDDWRFSVNEEEVKKQITFLKNNVAIISLKTLMDYLEGKKVITKPSVVLTFDDGYKDILKLKSFFEENNIKPALFVLSDIAHPNTDEMKTKRAFLSTSEIKSLKKEGWEIGCHSATHANLATLTDEEMTEEIVNAKKNLEKQLGFEVPYFAYPRGKYNQNVVRLVKKANYKLGLTMDDGMITTASDWLTLPRIGIDRTHSFTEFKTTFSPSVVKIRALIKKSFVGKYL